MCERELQPFCRKPNFTVRRIDKGGNERPAGRKRPKVEINNECLFQAIRLAKSGYFGGDPQSVLNAPVDIVQSLLEYERFIDDYESEYVFLNKKD